MNRALIGIAALSSCIIGCASSVAVQRVQSGDEQMSCEQLLSGMKDADKFRTDAQSKKGATGTNTAAALLFWPALFVTYSDANAAIQAADARKAYLSDLRMKKNCVQSAS